MVIILRLIVPNGGVFLVIFHQIRFLWSLVAGCSFVGIACGGSSSVPCRAPIAWIVVDICPVGNFTNYCRFPRKSIANYRNLAQVRRRGWRGRWGRRERRKTEQLSGHYPHPQSIFFAASVAIEVFVRRLHEIVAMRTAVGACTVGLLVDVNASRHSRSCLQHITGQFTIRRQPRQIPTSADS